MKARAVSFYLVGHGLWLAETQLIPSTWQDMASDGLKAGAASFYLVGHGLWFAESQSCFPLPGRTWPLIGWKPDSFHLPGRTWPLIDWKPAVSFYLTGYGLWLAERQGCSPFTWQSVERMMSVESRARKTWLAVDWLDTAGLVATSPPPLGSIVDKVVTWTHPTLLVRSPRAF